MSASTTGTASALTRALRRWFVANSSYRHAAEVKDSWSEVMVLLREELAVGPKHFPGVPRERLSRVLGQGERIHRIQDLLAETFAHRTTDTLTGVSDERLLFLMEVPPEASIPPFRVMLRDGMAQSIDHAVGALMFRGSLVGALLSTESQALSAGWLRAARMARHRAVEETATTEILLRRLDDALDPLGRLREGQRMPRAKFDELIGALDDVAQQFKAQKDRSLILRLASSEDAAMFFLQAPDNKVSLHGVGFVRRLLEVGDPEPAPPQDVTKAMRDLLERVGARE